LGLDQGPRKVGAVKQAGQDVGRVDPRSARSAEALAIAVVELASSQDVTTITITELCRRAGVTRKTFYNHAATPMELLRRALVAELDQVRRHHMDHIATQDNRDISGIVRESLTDIITHVRAHRDIYAQGETGRIHPELYQLLSDHFRHAVRETINTSARTIPRLPGYDDNAHRQTAAELYSAFVAHAYAGVIEASLSHPATADTDFIVDLIISALPPWMLRKSPFDTDQQPGGV
jgi:AcrR family transcriptional regulator